MIQTCQNVSFILSCLYFQALAPDDLGGFGLICYPLILSEAPTPVFPKHTRIQTTAMTHHSNNSVRDHMKWVSGSLLISKITAMMPVHFSVTPTIQPRSLSSDSLSWVPPLYTSLTCCLFCQAGLLGCEAVLSSMALMQANNIPGQKRMSSTLGQGHRASPESHHTQHGHNHHGHQSHHGQAHHSHMGHPSGGTCPPLVR